MGERLDLAVVALEAGGALAAVLRDAVGARPPVQTGLVVATVDLRLAVSAVVAGRAGARVAAQSCVVARRAVLARLLCRTDDQI